MNSLRDQIGVGRASKMASAPRHSHSKILALELGLQLIVCIMDSIVCGALNPKP